MELWSSPELYRKDAPEFQAARKTYGKAISIDTDFVGESIKATIPRHTNFAVFQLPRLHVTAEQFPEFWKKVEELYRALKSNA